MGLRTPDRLRQFWQRESRGTRRIVAACACVLVAAATAISLFLVAFAQAKTTYCGLEHEHVPQCYSDPQADVEKPATWEEALPTFATGTPRIARLVGIARAQLGYRESAANYLVVRAGAAEEAASPLTREELRGYTRYGAWAGDPYCDWNTPFVGFCLHYAEIDLGSLVAAPAADASPHALALASRASARSPQAEGVPAGEDEATHAVGPLDDAQAWMEALGLAGRLATPQGWTPAIGDLVFLREDAQVRVGIVSGVDLREGRMRLVEGDASGRVEELELGLSDETILCLATMPDELRAEYDAYAATTVEDETATDEPAGAEPEAGEGTSDDAESGTPASEGEEEPAKGEAPSDNPSVLASPEQEAADEPVAADDATAGEGAASESATSDAGQQADGDAKPRTHDEEAAGEAGDANTPAQAEDVEEAQPQAEQEPEEDPSSVPQVLFAQADDYLISVDMAGQARRGYELVARPLKVTARRVAEVEEALSDELPSGIAKRAHVEPGDVALYDITIRDAEGSEVEPEASVRLTVSRLMAEGDEDAQGADALEGTSCPAVAEVVHLPTVDGHVVPEALATEVTPEGVTFATDGLSPFAFVYTVDFEYGGYTYNLEGGGEVLLSQLVRELGMGFSAADAIQVSFSDPSLLDVAPVRDAGGAVTDWRLASRQPFATTEALHISLRSGELITIAVTDSQHITDLSRIITSATLSVDGVDIPWPVLVREGSYYDLRLEFKENTLYQFVDDETAMSYALPRGISIGDTDFERTFTMDVGDGVRLANNLLQYNAELRTFFIVWNTSDAVGFNKLKASAVAQFRVDLQVQFDFNPDKIDFGNDVFGEVIRDTSVDADLEKTGTYLPDEDRVDYEVRVTSRGAANGVVVRDVLYGEALSFVDAGGMSNGVSWESSLGDQSTAFVISDGGVDVPVEAQVVTLTDADVIDPRYEAHNEDGRGFELTLGQMQDGEVVTLRYSAAVDYDKLQGSGSWTETYNMVSAAVGGRFKTAEHSFEGEMRYVELAKSRDQVNWGDANTTDVRWTVRVNNNPKVSLAGTTVTDTIYAGDVEALVYAGSGLHVRAYTSKGVLVGEYDVPWSEDAEADTTQFARRVPREYKLDGKTDEDIRRLLDQALRDKAQAEADLEAAYELGGTEGEEAAVAAASRIHAAEQEIALYNGTGDPYQNESWSYTIPNAVTATNCSQTVTINNADNKYYYEISYTTTADKTKMVFDGYVGNEVTESRTNNLMQGGLYPPGVGTTPSVTKELDTRHAWAGKGSDEDYIYWKVSFQRQPYNLTRCVIEDDNPTLYGRREEVDVGDKAAPEFSQIHDGQYRIQGTDETSGGAEPFDILWVEGLSEEEGWQLAGATNTRTTIRFFRNRENVQPGLLGAGAGRDDTITIYLRTKNDEQWIEGTMTRYWPRDHTNTVTWIPNAHQVGASATTTPDIKKMEKVGRQVGSVRDPQTGVMLPVFRYEIYLTGLSDSDFESGRFQLNDTFNTRFLQFVEVTNYNSGQPNSADLVSHRFVMDPEDQQELGMSWWDQCFKGYSKANKWVGPVRATATDCGPGGEDGVTFTVERSDFTDTSRNRSGYEPGTEDEYCMRYSLSYYLVVKDANAAQRLAQLEPGTYEDGEFAGITKSDDGKVLFSNEAEWGNTTLKSQVDADADFNPMSKTLVYDNETDTCTYTIVINPQRLQLNNGETVCVRDTYTNLAVDFLTVATGIETEPPDRKSQVDWSYHNNVGTFWIPDETMVTITYTAKPIGDPGKSVTFNNTVSMLGFEPRSVLKTVKLNSESEGSAGDYNIRLFKFADNSMNVPLEGAVFQLFEEDATGKVPVTFASDNTEATSRYTGDEEQFSDVELLTRQEDLVATSEPLASPSSILVDDGNGGTAPLATNEDGSTSAAFPARESHRVGDYVYFCTTKYGYADIHLNKSKDGIALERGKQYYLKEVVTPAGYTKEDIFWSFIIDDMDYFDSESGVYVYRDGGVLTVSNSSSDSGIVLRKVVRGDEPPWEAQKGMGFHIEVRERDTGAVVYRRSATYEDFARDNDYDASNPDSTPLRFKIPKENLGELDTQKAYVISVEETDADVVTHARTTTTKTKVGDNPQTSPVAGMVATAEATGHELLDDAHAVRFWFTNTYTARPVGLTVSKTWGEKAQQKHHKSVEFELYRHGLREGSDTAFETIPIKLTWDAASGTYRPNDAEPGDGTIVLDGTEDEPWSKGVSDLPRYDHKGNAYVYSVLEKAATFADAPSDAPTTVMGEDLDTCFTISARDEDGELLPMSGTTATADVFGKLSAEVNVTNEIATLIPLHVAKTWSDADDNDHEGEDLTFDLYRTTESLPTGGGERETYTITTYNDQQSSAFPSYRVFGDRYPHEVQLRNGDLIELVLTPDYSVDYSGSDTTWRQHHIGFNGLAGFRNDNAVKEQWSQEFLEAHGNPPNTSKEAYYAFEPQYAIRADGVSFNSALIFNNYSQKGITGNSFGANPVIRLGLVVDHLEQFGGTYTATNYTTGQSIRIEDASHTLFLRGYNREIIVESIRNITQENENLQRDQLLAKAAKTTAQLVRSNVSLKEANGWEWSAQFPRDDGNGHEYTYFVLEHPVAGYTDGYRVTIGTTEDEDDEDPRDHAIDVVNTKDPDPDPETPTQLRVTKEVAFEPASSGVAADYDDVPFHITVKSGNRYVVNATPGAAEPTWALMSPTAYANAGLSPYLSVTPGEGGLAIAGLPEGLYVIEEFDGEGAYDADIEGYRRTTTYSSQTVTLKAGELRERSILNTYAPIPPDGTFSFSKLWTSQADDGGASTDSMPVEWPMGEVIRVTLHRHLVEPATGAAAFADDDERFRVTYDIRRSYDPESNSARWSVELAEGVEQRTDGLKIPPAIVPPEDAGRFFNYVFVVTGVEEQVERGDAGAATTYDCAYYVDEAPLAHYQTAYGGVAGAAPYITAGATHAEAGKAIVNQFEEASIRFSKEWYGQNREERLAAWPTRIIEKDPESDEGADPDAVTQTEPVPITLRLGRRLRYEDGGTTLESRDFDPTYDVVFPNLTDRKTYSEIHPDEGKITLSMQNNDGSFDYTISRLQKYGAMTVDGVERQGEWAYYVFESNVDGYQASYLEADYLLGLVVGHHTAMDGDREAVSVQNDGIIRNTQLLGTMALQKQVSGVELAEDKTFEFVVRRKSGAGTSLYLLEDGRLVGENAPHVLTLTVRAGKTSGWLNFQDVIPGEYEIRELGTINADGTDVDGGSAHIPGYDLDVTPTIGTLAHDDQSGQDVTLLSTARDVTLRANSTTQATFANAYRLKTTNVQFHKAWLPPADAQDATTPRAWPAGESVTVELRRKVVVDAGDPSQDVADDDFVLVYEGTQGAGGVSWVAAQGESHASETDADRVIVSATSDADDVQLIRFQNLTRCVLGGEHAGREWTYYLVERPNPTSVYGVHYGTVEGGQGVVDDSATQATGTEVDAAGAVVGARDASALINREDCAKAQVTKVWQDSEGTVTSWAADAGGQDLAITIVATGTEDGGAGTDEQRFAVTGAPARAAGRYTLDVDEDAHTYTYTLYGLKLGYTYAFGEAPLAGYDQAVTTSAGTTTITNRKKEALPEETTSVTIRKVWDDAASHKNDVSYFRVYSAVAAPGEGFVQFNIRPEFYYANGDPAIPNGGRDNGPYLWVTLNSDRGNGINYKYQSGGEVTYVYDTVNSRNVPGWQLLSADNLSTSYKVSTSLSANNLATYAITGYSVVRLPQGDAVQAVITDGARANVPVTGSYKNEDEVNLAIRMTVADPAPGNATVDRAPLGRYDGLPPNAVPTNRVVKVNYGATANPGNQVTVADLPLYDSYGRMISYYVVEDATKTATQRFNVRYEHEGNDWVVTNTPTYKSVSVTKRWHKADGSQAAWPQDGGGDDLGVTLRVTRRLAYEDGGIARYTDEQGATAFSLTYNLTSAGGTLTHVDGKAATAAEQAAYPLTVARAGNDYTYTVAGLENVGTLADGGANRTGTWDYRFEETSVPAGYGQPAYFDAQAGVVAGSGAKAPEGGSILNAQEPAKAQFAVTKDLRYGEGHWPADGFAFTLAYDDAGTRAAAPGQDGIAAPVPAGAQTVSVTTETASSQARFDEVSFAQAGTYLFTIREEVPDAAVSSDGATTWAAVRDHPDQWASHQWFAHEGIRYRHLPCAVTAVVAEEDGALRVESVDYDAGATDLTVTNTYAGKVGFGFGKVWLKPDATLPASAFDPWPAGESVDLILKRYCLDGGSYVEDVDFAVLYLGVGAQADEVAPTAVTEGGVSRLASALEADALQALTLARTGSAANLYAFRLPDASLEGLDPNGNRYEYRMVEMDDATTPHAEYALINASEEAYATSRAYAADEGVIVNRDEHTGIQVTKVWQDVQGAREDGWPSGAAIDLTLGWQAAGGAEGTLALDGIGAGMTGEGYASVRTVTLGGTDYDVSVTAQNANPATVSIDGLPFADASGNKITYALVEAPVAGYLAPTYSNLASQSSSSLAAYDGATITNRVMPAEQAVPFAVTKRLVLSSDTTQEASAAMWPEEGFSFALAYEGYKAADGLVGAYDYEYAHDGYYDATGYPLLAMPPSTVATVLGGTPSHTATFGAVRFYRAGTYFFTIEEEATSDYYRRDESTYRAKVTVSDDGGVLTAGEPVYYDEEWNALPARPVVTNQYKAHADATFSKVWLSSGASLPASTFASWPSGASVDVVLMRYEGATRDAGFEVAYTIGATDATVVPTSVRAGAYQQSDDASDYVLTRTMRNNVYTFATPEALARKSAAGTDYQYFFAEPTQVSGYLDAQYGTLSRGVVERKRDAVDKIESGGVVINVEEQSGAPELPSTGGFGTAGIASAGAALLALSAALARRRLRR